MKLITNIMFSQKLRQIFLDILLMLRRLRQRFHVEKKIDRIVFFQIFERDKTDLIYLLFFFFFKNSNAIFCKINEND